MKLLFKHNLSKKILIWYDKNKKEIYLYEWISKRQTHIKHGF